MADWPYSTAAWQRLRKAKLSETPLCETCALRGRRVVAEHVDHVVSIASGGYAFPALDGLRSLCPPCHSIKTNALDRRGGKGVAIKGCDEHGLPLDPDHPFVQPAARSSNYVKQQCGLYPRHLGPDAARSFEGRGGARGDLGDRTSPRRRTRPASAPCRLGRDGERDQAGSDESLVGGNPLQGRGAVAVGPPRGNKTQLVRDWDV